jgi:DNA-binding winged helix-turn-helix (wHTH) protein/tetratricopeptide (TPR) repeat protein
MPASAIPFPPFQLDVRNAQLRRDGTPVGLRPKTFAVLCHLAERPGELVTKAALLDAVWPGIAVTEDVIRISVRELRAALGDERAQPRFIETVPRRGYRFLPAPGAAPEAPAEEPATSDLVVGRASERARIREWMRAAAGGARQLVFVTGEAGIGKTTLVDAAVRDLERSSATSLRVARGQCVEQYGGGAPYEPVLEALASLCRRPDGESIKAVLQRRAPQWLLDLLGAAPTSHPDRVDVDSHAHMLHMLATSVAALAAETPLVLVFEDLHWSDYSTLDLVSVLAQGRDPARLLVLCTLRTSEAIARRHPLASVKRELLRKGRCQEVSVAGLSAADVAQYLSVRFPDVRLSAELLPLLVERSDGNPFFLVTLVDHLLESGMLVKDGGSLELRGAEALRTSIPDGLRAVIEPRLDRLEPDELRVLEVATIAGSAFAAHAVAAAAPAGSELGDIEVVEGLCDGLARRQEIVRADGESAWPDGTTSARYAFRHALYRQVLDQRLSTTARRRLHQAVGERLETGHAGRTAEVASSLAAHFERSGDAARAVRYHGEAAAAARARFAAQETRFHVEAALDLMRAQPETRDGLQQSLPLLSDLGWASIAARGWGDERAASAFAQMREIAERLDTAEARFKAMEGELVVHVMRAEYASARKDGEDMLELGEQIGNRYAIAGALAPIGATAMHFGEIEAAQSFAERGRVLGHSDEPTMQTVSCWVLLAATFTHQGRVAEARETHRETLALAAGSEPYVLAHAASYIASNHQLIGDVPGACEMAAEAERIANDLGFTVLASIAALYRAWAAFQEGGGRAALERMRAAFDAYVASGQRISTTSYAVVVAEACLAVGDLEQASSLLDFSEAFVAETGERLNESVIHRLRGEWLLAGPPSRSRRAAAVDCFERAIAIAAAQGALIFELAAAVALHRVEPKAARARLAQLVSRFGPEDEYPTLRRATALLGLPDRAPRERTR